MTLLDIVQRLENIYEMSKSLLLITASTTPTYHLLFSFALHSGSCVASDCRELVPESMVTEGGAGGERASLDLVFDGVSVSAVRNRSSTSLVLLVLCPPRQIKAADAMPQVKVIPMSEPVVQPGRLKLGESEYSQICGENLEDASLPIQAPHCST